MSMKAMAAVMAFVAGEPVNVARVCRDCGISRKTFYKYVARCRVEGAAGFEERSRRPLTFPGAVAGDVEDAVVAERKELADEGHEHGATTIQYWLGKDQQFKGRVPSVATVHRILVRRGFVLPQPEKSEVVVATLRSASAERVVAGRLHRVGDRRRRAGQGVQLPR